MPHMDTFAVVLTHNRPALLRQTVDAIGPQVDLVIVIDNASEPPVDHHDLDGEGRRVCVLNVHDQPPNLAELWQLGIDVAEKYRLHTAETPVERESSWRIAFL